MPVEEGSIVARLRVDSSDFKAKLAEAQVQAEELGRTDPTIRVDVDSASAISKIAAVEAAQRRVSIASEATRLSYLRLDEIQSKEGVSAVRVAAAHLAASRAENAEKSAVERLTAAKLALAAADDDETHATEKSAAAHGLTVNRTGLIIAAIVALIPLLAALSGYAVGVAGALAGMGAAGVLAVIGIKNAIDDGTLEGAKFSAGLKTMKANLDSLAGTAASAMLPAFQQAISQITSDLPELNTEIAGFSSQLGRVGNAILTGVIQAFKVLNPLFVQAGEYVEDLAEGFKKWTEDGGLKKFADYAQDALPRVAQTLGSLATAILHIVEATAPIGDVVLGILTALGEVINAIPTPVLTVLIGAAAGVYLGFKVWKAIPGIIGKVKDSMTALGGALPIAGFIALITEVGNLIGLGIGDTTFQMTAVAGAYKQLDSALQSGDLGTAKAKRSVAQLRATLDNARGYMGGFVGTMIDLSNNLEKNGFGWLGGPVQGVIQSMFGKTTQKLDQYRAAVKAQKQAQDDAVKSGLDFSDATSLGGSVAATVASDLGMTSDSYTTLASNIDAATAAAKTWKTEQDILNGAAQSVEQTNVKMAGDYLTMAANIAAATKETNKATATSLDINTQYGNQNHQMILQQVQDAQAKSDAIVASEMAQGKGTVTAHNDAAKALEAEKQSIIEHAVQLGLDRDAVTALVNEELKIQPQITQTFTLKGIESGKQKLQDYLQLVAGIHDITQRITVEANFVGGAQNLATTGGLKAAFAAGGTVNGPGSSTSDSVIARLSNSEEVTANDQGQASKYRAALKAINANAPVSAVQSILAGMRSSSAGTVSASPAPVVNVHAPSAVPASNVYKFYITEASDADATAQRVLHYIQNTSA